MKFAPSLAGVLFCALTIAAQPSLAASEARNCPPEPTLNVPIVSSYVFAGTNCAITPVTDIDSFKFNGNVNDVYRIALSLNGVGWPTNICMDVWDPNGATVATACTNTNNTYSAVITQKLPLKGTYTIFVREAGNDSTAPYAISLQRLFPVAADARQLAFPSEVVSDEVNPLTDSDVFYVSASDKGTFQVTATIAGAWPQNLCFDVVGPDGVIPPEWAGRCTNTNTTFSASVQIKPPVAGLYSIVVYESGYDSVTGYTLSVQCLLPECKRPLPYPFCTLKNSASHANGTLTMDFTVGNKQPATWKAWLVDQNRIRLLWSVQQPVTNPPIQVTKTATTGPEGRVGVLSVLTTPARGVACSTWTLVNTGTPPGVSAEPETEDDDMALTESEQGSAIERIGQFVPER